MRRKKGALTISTYLRRKSGG